MNEKLTLQDVTDKVAARIGVTKKVSDDFLREFFALIVDSLEKDGLVKIKGLGTFKLKSVEERKSVNVQTGAEMVIPAHMKVTYTPDKGLSTEINKPYAHLQTYILDQDGPIEAPSYEEDSEEGTTKVDNSIFVNSVDDEDDDEALGHYYFNDEADLAVGLQEEQFSSSEAKEEKVEEPMVISTPDPVEKVQEPIQQLPSSETKEVENPTPAPETKEETDAVPSFVEAQPQEGQVIPTFTEQPSVIGTPSINPGPVVTLFTDEHPEEEKPVSVDSQTNSFETPHDLNVEKTETVENTQEQNPVVTEPSPEPQVHEPEPPVEVPFPSEEKTSVVEQEKVENSGVEETKMESSQVSGEVQGNSENVEKQENSEQEVEKEAEPDKKEEGKADLEQNQEKRRSTNIVGLLIFFLILLLLGLIGYIYKDELKPLLFPTEETEQVEEATPPALSEPETSNEAEEEEVINEDLSDSNVSGDIIQRSDEGALDQQPEVPEEPLYSFAPTLVQYMKENHPNEDISISGIKDEVKLTSGRRLVDLSLRYYGHKFFWVYIYFFNTDVIKDPNKLVPGTMIKIPELNPALVDKNDKQKLDMAFEIKNLIGK